MVCTVLVATILVECQGPVASGQRVSYCTLCSTLLLNTGSYSGDGQRSLLWVNIVALNDSVEGGR